MADTQAYREWLATGNAQVALVETLQISHATLGDLNIANWDQNLICKTEAGDSVTFVAGRFYLEPAEVSDNTGQGTVLTIAALGGIFYQAIKDMTVDERTQPITLTHRSYLRNNLNQQLINPPPRWTVHAIEATTEAIRAEIRSEPLRVRRVGLYYTAQEFPVLVYT